MNLYSNMISCAVISTCWIAFCSAFDTHVTLNQWLTCTIASWMPTILDSILNGADSTKRNSKGCRLRGVGSHKVVGSKDYVPTENSQMATISAFSLPYIYHTNQLNLWPISSGSWLSACPGEMKPFKDQLSTHGHLTSLRKSHSKSSQDNFKQM